jgi:hypothetical protein
MITAFAVLFDVIIFSEETFIDIWNLFVFALFH